MIILVFLLAIPGLDWFRFLSFQMDSAFNGIQEVARYVDTSWLGFFLLGFGGGRGGWWWFGMLRENGVFVLETVMNVKIFNNYSTIDLFIDFEKFVNSVDLAMFKWRRYMEKLRFAWISMWLRCSCLWILDNIWRYRARFEFCIWDFIVISKSDWKILWRKVWMYL